MFMAYWRTQGSLTTRMVREFIQECVPPPAQRQVENLVAFSELRPPSDGAHPLYAGRHVEKPKVEEPAAPTLLDVIDGHIKALIETKEIRLLSPDGRIAWLIALRGQRVLTVLYRPASSLAWRELNPGWNFSDQLKPIDGARIIIGQILIGKRVSGVRLEDLTCSYMISDHRTTSYNIG